MRRVLDFVYDFEENKNDAVIIRILYSIFIGTECVILLLNAISERRLLKALEHSQPDN